MAVNGAGFAGNIMLQGAIKAGASLVIAVDVQPSSVGSQVETQELTGEVFRRIYPLIDLSLRARAYEGARRVRRCGGRDCSAEMLRLPGRRAPRASRVFEPGPAAASVSLSFIAELCAKNNRRRTRARGPRCRGCRARTTS